jgi:hypothetical protein
MVIVFGPIVKPLTVTGLPLVADEPFTVTVALASLTVGVTAILVVPLLTLAVYPVVPLTKVGERVPGLIAKLDNVASLDNRVTVIV